MLHWAARKLRNLIGRGITARWKPSGSRFSLAEKLSGPSPAIIPILAIPILPNSTNNVDHVDPLRLARSALQRKAPCLPARNPLPLLLLHPRRPGPKQAGPRAHDTLRLHQCARVIQGVAR